MKTETLRGVLVSALLAVTALADDARVETYKDQLRDVRPPELPLETARLISSQKANAADAVRAAISLSGASPQLIVASVAKASPKSAAAAAATAIATQPKLTSNPQMQPKLTVAITKAAISAAPSEIFDIVAESCKARPASFYTIGVAAAEAAPRATDKVIPAITSGVPALKPIIQRAQADFKTANRSASLALVLKHAENLLFAIAHEQNLSPEALLAKETETSLAQQLVAKADTLPPPPVQRPPFVSGPTIGEIRPPNTTEVPPSGRNYSSP
jgi:hypothetical protein